MITRQMRRTLQFFSEPLFHVIFFRVGEGHVVNQITLSVEVILEYLIASIPKNVLWDVLQVNVDAIVCERDGHAHDETPRCKNGVVGAGSIVRDTHRHHTGNSFAKGSIKCPI